MRRSVTIALATFVVVFFFAMSLTLTLASQAFADIPNCCNPCPPSCEAGLGIRINNGPCTPTPGTACNYTCRCY